MKSHIERSISFSAVSEPRAVATGSWIIWTGIVDPVATARGSDLSDKLKLIVHALRLRGLYSDGMIQAFG